MSMLGASAASVLFLAATAAALAIGAGWASRWAARLAGGALVEAAIVALLLAGLIRLGVVWRIQRARTLGVVTAFHSRRRFTSTRL